MQAPKTIDEVFAPAKVGKPQGFALSDVVVKTSHPMPAMEALACGTLSQINPNLALLQFQMFDAQIAGSLERPIACWHH